jgi:hypothetical protein
MNRYFLAAVAAVIAISPALHAQEFEKGAKLQTLSVLHPDMARRQLYTVNYQLEGRIPVCSEVTVKKMSGKALVFDYQGVEYTMEYEKNTKNAGIPFEEAVRHYFGPACDKAKIAKLSKIDKDGIQTGMARVGMSKDGVLFALGRPPQHANPTLDGDYWLYWRNRFGKMGIQFDAKGKVTAIK